MAFLEGIFVAPDARRRSIARALVAAVGHWARRRGMVELASDADIANTVSHTTHRALGFQETERVVFFRKPLGEASRTSRAHPSAGRCKLRGRAANGGTTP
ncbi:MAG: GNAT family N-acetyltransferase [Pseudomonadales bacterium]